MAEYRKTERASCLLNNALERCKEYRHEYITPEHLLIVLIEDERFYRTLNKYYNPQDLKETIEVYLMQQESISTGLEYEPELSVQMSTVMASAAEDVSLSSARLLDVPHLVNGILKLRDSWAAYWLKGCLNGNDANFMSYLIGNAANYDALQNEGIEEDNNVEWRSLVTCMNDHCYKHNPLIGREQELKRTIQILCRRDKNNPIHVGEPGVGKTSLVWGLARLIEENKVPNRLIGSRIYQIDMCSLLAGTQYRGDFENRIKQIMDGIMLESNNNIVYIDEIHTLIGAGSTRGNAMDASNMLKPYLESGSIRFIGSTTYEEYSRYISLSKALVRRFQQIDILEPTIEEAKHIIRLL